MQSCFYVHRNATPAVLCLLPLLAAGAAAKPTTMAM
jgi:hypothetical protein